MKKHWPQMILKFFWTYENKTLTSILPNMMFWDELSAYIEEIHPAVDDQRHSNVLHIPIAISLHHLRDTIKEGLHQKCRKASVHHWSG
ncbi:MAG: hypothetical protein MJE68_16520, partial [Proteobacteria bacterium]|nr:hypothetical protein [Pseudomonadota bacterium]